MKLVNATGASGKVYQAQMKSLVEVLPKAAGIYIFVRQEAEGPRALYVGQTHDFDQRIGRLRTQHNAWVDLCREKATHVALVPFNGSEAQRIQIETDLRNGLQPVCNKQ